MPPGASKQMPAERAVAGRERVQAAQHGASRCRRRGGSPGARRGRRSARPCRAGTARRGTCNSMTSVRSPRRRAGTGVLPASRSLLVGELRMDVVLERDLRRGIASTELQAIRRRTTTFGSPARSGWRCCGPGLLVGAGRLRPSEPDCHRRQHVLDPGDVGEVGRRCRRRIGAPGVVEADDRVLPSWSHSDPESPGRPTRGTGAAGSDHEPYLVEEEHRAAVVAAGPTGSGQTPGSPHS